MVKLLQITFRNPQASSEAAQQAAWERAHSIAAWPGLVWKIWIATPADAIYGGIYLFEDEHSANAYLNSPIADSIRAIPGISDFEAQLFDINNPLTAVTRGPLTSMQTEPRD
ncbi:MAG: YdhR family protein [Cyanobacteria bacterium]|nr:YdhR family protein [Cyanobacteriota bacterium]